MMKFINENKYSQGKGKISCFFSRLLREFLVLASATILMIVFYKIIILSLLDELPQTFIPYFITE